MVLFLSRCPRLLSLTGIQNNLRKRGLQSILSCNLKSQGTRLQSHHTCILSIPVQYNRLELEYSGKRQPFHTSIPLCKKFDKKDYESLRILDPAGKFLCDAELYVLKKFCHHFKRFSFEEVKPDSEGISNFDLGDGKLRVFKLSDKMEGNSDASKDVKTKVIKFHRERSTKGGKTEKLIELLVDHGKVNITFDRKNSAAEEAVSTLKDLLDVKVVVSADELFYFVKLKEINNTTLLKLFEHIHEKEAKHIAQVKDMLETIKGQE